MKKASFKIREILDLALLAATQILRVQEPLFVDIPLHPRRGERCSDGAARTNWTALPRLSRNTGVLPCSRSAKEAVRHQVVDGISPNAAWRA